MTQIDTDMIRGMSWTFGPDAHAQDSLQGGRTNGSSPASEQQNDSSSLVYEVEEVFRFDANYCYARVHFRPRGLPGRTPSSCS